MEVLRCEVDRRIERAFASSPGWIMEGSVEPLLGDQIPAQLHRSAWRAVRDRVVARDGRRCQECGKELGSVPAWLTEVHHIVPKAKGGSDHPSNLMTLCVMCHRRHTDEMAMADWESLKSLDRYRIAERFQEGYWSEERVLNSRNPSQ
jgi:5-methylcytosine-specific restriction protein A